MGYSQKPVWYHVEFIEDTIDCGNERHEAARNRCAAHEGRQGSSSCLRCAAPREAGLSRATEPRAAEACLLSSLFVLFHCSSSYIRPNFSFLICFAFFVLSSRRKKWRRRLTAEDGRSCGKCPHRIHLWTCEIKLTTE